ncbi:MAG TPA: glycosyl hydrolase family 65 protein [Clostridia bacterium]|nr:glycosyl hydrolase family 65 protein [Clostridia bacterium]
MSWLVADEAFDAEKIVRNGNKFIIGNGYMGYRGTLEEYGKEQLAACVLSGIYDKVGDKWREPVNAPNGLFARLYCNGKPVSALSSVMEKHRQLLDIKYAVHGRETVFSFPENGSLTISSERFASLDDVHLLCMKYSFRATFDCDIEIETGIDGDIWDINGPHLKDVKSVMDDEGVILMKALTNEQSIKVSVAECLNADFKTQLEIADSRIMRRLRLKAESGVQYSFTKFVSVYTGADTAADPGREAALSCLRARRRGYDLLRSDSEKIWDERWESSDVVINGDDEAQYALRYSLYQLLIIAPAHNGRLSIPARGLSGQVYKGAIFWDTEMFILPFFIHTNPEVARNIVMYRIHTLEGARRKASEYGFRGAFYAWESQDTGDDACTEFNVTDVFTERPMRTYFRDKQVHISADVVYGIWQYYTHTGDESVLLEGGAEVILECARFYYSYAYYKKEKSRFEILDVTGPDEYHERVHNNAFTNRMVKSTLETALSVLKILKESCFAAYENLIAKLDYEKDIENITDLYEHLYIPQPQAGSLVIEQFDGYRKLEDVGLSELKKRILNKNEYLGGGSGLATTTRIIKQADTVLMLNIFRDDYSMEIKKANWEYYEPRTEHGSSLSPCVYALVAADTGNAEWGYDYFMKTATIDLTGESKQYVGSLYIGGTHPAANGGAWMSAVFGFGGLGADMDTIRINPALPSKWISLEFVLFFKKQKFKIGITKKAVSLSADISNTRTCTFDIKGKLESCEAGRELHITY